MSDTDRLRVLVLCGELDASGSPRVALNVSKHLVESADITVGYLWGSDELVPEFAEHGIPAVRLGDEPGDPSALVSLWRLVSAYRPDVVHTHMIPAGWCGRVVSRLRNVPVVSTIHTPYDDRSFPARVLDLSTSFLSMVNVSVSNTVSESLPLYFGLGARSAVVHNCVDPDDLRIRGAVSWEDAEWNDGLLKDQPIIANVARFDPKKRKADLVRALPAVLDEFPDTVVVLTGWGEDRSHVEAVVRSLSVEESVVFTDNIPNPYSVYRHADVVVLPSVSEGFSISMLEAMAFGKPIVATDIPSFREALGLDYPLVPPRDPPALATAVERYLRDPTRAKQAGKTVRERVEREFSGHKAARAYLDIYESVNN